MNLHRSCLSAAVTIALIANVSSVNGQQIRRAKAAKSDEPLISHLDLRPDGSDKNTDYAIGTPSDIDDLVDVTCYDGSSPRKGKKDKKRRKCPKSQKAAAVTSVYQSVVSEFCNSLTDCSSAVTIDSTMQLTSDLTCTGTITVGQGASLNANGFTIFSDQAPAVILKNGGKLENAAIAGSTSVGVRFDDKSGLLDNVKYEGTGTAVEVTDDSKNVQIKSLSSTTAATLISVAGGTGTVFIDEAKYTGTGTAVVVDNIDRSVSVISLFVTGSSTAVAVTAANQVSVSNLVCEDVNECIFAQSLNKLTVENTDILGTTVGNGITFDSADGDVSIQTVFVKNALLDGINIAAARSVMVKGSKFVGNGQDGVDVDECSTIVMEDVLAGSNRGNGIAAACTNVTEDASFEKTVSLGNDGTDLDISLSLEDPSDQVLLDHIVACDSGSAGVDSNGSISLSIAGEDRLVASNIVTDGCTLNGDGTCSAIGISELRSCQDFCADPPSESSSSGRNSSGD